MICSDDEDTVTEYMFPDYERKPRDDDFLHEKDYHQHLVKLLSTVEQSVTTDMDKREKVAMVVAEKNGKLPLSVYECKLDIKTKYLLSTIHPCLFLNATQCNFSVLSPPPLPGIFSG